MSEQLIQLLTTLREAIDKLESKAAKAALKKDFNRVNALTYHMEILGDIVRALEKALEE